MTAGRTDVEVGERRLSISNLDKVLWPQTATTKADLIGFYRDVAPVMVTHLRGRPITLRRWPDGVEAHTFFQKHAPRHRPDWIPTVELGGVDYLRIEEPAALVWAAGQAAIEIHPGLATAPDLARPTFLVLDLDPGAPADILTCARVALILRRYLDAAGLRAWPKTSGSKGLQLYVPLGGTATFDSTGRYARSLAQQAEAEHADLIVSVVGKVQRRGKVLIDWSQNAPSRTTVAVYSVRALPRPGVSTPVSWEEMEEALAAGDPARLRFDMNAAITRLGRHGDLMADTLDTTQQLPD